MGGVPSYTPYSQVNSSRSMKSVTMPVFGNGYKNMLTRRETDRTDDEIKNSIKELAKKDAARGVHGRDTDFRGTPSQEFQDLLHEYVGSVSPDRRAIFQAGIAQLQKAISIKIGVPHIDYSILEMWLSGKKINLKNANVEYNAHDKTMELTNLDFFENGEFIGTYNGNHGWYYSFTEAEQSRNEEIHRLYVDAWKAERKEMGAPIF
jgi:hypothetical protein